MSVGRWNQSEYNKLATTKEKLIKELREAEDGLKKASDVATAVIRISGENGFSLFLATKH